MHTTSTKRLSDGALFAALILAFMAGPSSAHNAAFESLIREGVEARSKKELDRSIRILQQARELSPLDPRAALELAAAYEWAENLVMAESVYRGYLKSQPSNTSANLGLARVLRWRWQFEEALLLYKQVLASIDVSVGMRVEADLGIAQIDRLEFRLPQARDRLEGILAQYPLDTQALEEINQVNASFAQRLNLLAGQSKGPTSATILLSAEWSLKQNARTMLKLGASRNSSSSQALITESISNEIQNFLYIEQSSFASKSLYWRWRAEYRHRSAVGNGYQLQGDWSDQVASLSRANAGLTLTRPSAQMRRTVHGGLSYAFAPSWDAGVTGFLSTGGEASAQKNLLARLGWEQGRTLAQVFVSRELGQTTYKQTALVSIPVGKYQLRTQLQHDGKSHTNSWLLALRIPFDNGSSIQLQRDAEGSNKAWSVAADIAIPNH